MTKRSPFRYFKTSPEIIRLAVMLYVRFPLSLWNVEDLLHERGIETSHESVRFWWHRFGPLFASEWPSKRGMPVFRSAPPAKVVVATGHGGCRSTANGTVCGGLLITKAKSWRVL